MSNEPKCYTYNKEGSIFENNLEFAHAYSHLSAKTICDTLNRLEAENAELRDKVLELEVALKIADAARILRNATPRTDSDWTTTCKCEYSGGSTWCCNNCGKPTPRTNVNNICPISNEHCDDEACPPDSICNMSGNEIECATPRTDGVIELPILKDCKPLDGEALDILNKTSSRLLRESIKPRPDADGLRMAFEAGQNYGIEVMTSTQKGREMSKYVLNFDKWYNQFHTT